MENTDKENVQWSQACGRVSDRQNITDGSKITVNSRYALVPKDHEFKSTIFSAREPIKDKEYFGDIYIGEFKMGEHDDVVMVVHGTYLQNDGDCVIIRGMRNPEKAYQGMAYMDNETGKISYPDDAVHPTKHESETIVKIVVSKDKDVDIEKMKNIVIRKEVERKLNISKFTGKKQYKKTIPFNDEPKTE